MLVKGARSERCYRRYSQVGHNSRTCKVELKDIEGNSALKEAYSILIN